MYNLPILSTDRLIIRDISIYDAKDMYEYAKTPYVGPNAGWAPHTSIDETIIIINMFIESKRRGQLGTFAITLRKTGKMIGTIELYNYTPNFKAELGYALNPEYWGQGIIVEASQAILKWGFTTLNLKRIEVATFIDNYQSQRVCQKLGFIEEGVARNGYLRYDGKLFDKIVFGMTDTEYFNNKNNHLHN